jgi:hypothetical protein
MNSVKRCMTSLLASADIKVLLVLKLLMPVRLSNG